MYIFSDSLFNARPQLVDIFMFAPTVKMYTENNNMMIKLVKPHHNTVLYNMVLHITQKWESKDHSVYAPSQSEMALQCNAMSHWLGA